MNVSTRYLERDALGRLLDLLVERGYELIGPTVRDGAIVLDRIDGVDDLPRGIREIQGPGTYRLEQTGDDRLFEWAHGPDSGKRYLFPPRETIQTGTRDPDGELRIAPAPVPDVRYAFIGLRACDLHAIEIQDKVFIGADPAYRARRERSVAIGVNCSTPGETCFCVSMNTGPRCTTGYDIALTELDDGFTAEAGTDAGADLIEALTTVAADDAQVAASLAVSERAAERMGRKLETADLPGLL
ncbi:MAG: sulfite reductase subunit A, partial [Actinomycetota bacterium]